MVWIGTVFRAMTPLAAFAVLTVGAGCGSRKPMDDKGSLISWSITDSAVNFANCADDPMFVSNFTAFPIQSVVAYRLAKDGQSATGVSCSDACSNCQVSCQDNTLSYTVAGDSLLLSAQQSQAIMGTNPVCNLNQTLSREYDDQGTTLSISDAYTLTLSGDTTQCGLVDSSEKMASPNGLGVEGCVVTFTGNASFYGSQ